MNFSSDATHVPPLMTSGSPYPLPPRLPTTRSEGHPSSQHASLTTSYADVATAVRDARNTLMARDVVFHKEMAIFDIGAYSILRCGAVLRPPVRVYVNQATAGVQASVRIGSFTYVGPQVVCEAAEVGQLVRMDEQCVVATGARIPDGVWLLPKTFVPADAVLAPYTTYSGVPASPVAKMNARAYQHLHLNFMRELRTLAERGTGA